MVCATDGETGRVLVRLRFRGTLFSTTSSEETEPEAGRL